MAALAGLALVSIAFLIGPFSKLFPSKFEKFLAWRKLIGRVGLMLVIWHALYSFFDFYSADIGKLLAPNLNALSIGAAILGLLIFLVMSMTSNDDAVRRIGYKNWKTIQTVGYVGLFLAIAHFALGAMKPGIGFHMKPSELLIFSLAVFTLAVRIVTIFMKVPERKKFEEHFGEK